MNNNTKPVAETQRLMLRGTGQNILKLIFFPQAKKYGSKLIIQTALPNARLAPGIFHMRIKTNSPLHHHTNTIIKQTKKQIMQHFKQVSMRKLLSTSFLASFAMLFLFSCSKNLTETPAQDNTNANTLNASSASKMNNGLVAVPFEETLFIPCANEGAGENVTLTGTTHFVYQMTWNDHGFSLVYHANSQRVTGVGLSSGETFIGSEGTQGSAKGSWVNNQWIGTTIEQMRMIGRNSKYLVKYKYHLIVTPDGDVKVSTSEKTIDCITK